MNMKLKSALFALAALFACACTRPDLKVYLSDSGLEKELLVWQEMLARHKDAEAGKRGACRTEMGYVRIVSDREMPAVRRCENEAAADLVIALDDGMPEEAFRIADGRLTAGSPAGVFLGLQELTLELLAGTELDSVCVEINPEFAHRGALLDCGRHFFSVGEVKEFIDILALNKMNVFHWHLTEDQGWRIAIDKYPLLTEIGSVRHHTDEARYNDWRDASRDSLQYGPYFYTKEQIRDIVAYAADRHIKVVPEIDMPGHMLAALASYPHLGCRGQGYEVWTHWGISPDVICLGRESSYEFLMDVIDEVLALFPSDMIHIGGDEAPTVRWEECPDCRRFMEEHGMKEAGELQKYMSRLVGDHIRAAGRSCIVWDDAIDGGLDTAAVVMNWSCRPGRLDAVRANGNRIIQTAKYNCYLDYYQTYEPLKNGEVDMGARRYLPLQRCYEFDPLAGFSEDEAARVIGLQGNVWTEHMPSFDQVEFMMLPRLTALAEVGLGTKLGYDDFLTRLKEKYVPAYEYFGFVYAPFALDGTEPYCLSEGYKVKY